MTAPAAPTWIAPTLVRLESGRRVLLVSNRLPVTVRRTDDGLVVERSSGGLATGLSGPHERGTGAWIGWPGLLDDIDATERAALGTHLDALRAIPVELSQPEVETFYDHISNAVLWPAFHGRLDRLPLVIEGWDTYESVNARFAEVVAEQYRPGDLVWIHDYQLLRLPLLLRRRLPRARIGFFLHIPFPGFEAYSAIPTRRWLLEGMLGADLIGFHTPEYRDNFRNAVRRLVGRSAADSRDSRDSRASVQVDGRCVRLGVFPMGVDADALEQRAASRAVADASATFREDGLALLVGVDRLDYSKGLPRRLLAFEQLLLRHPEWRGKVRLIQVAVPTRVSVAEYQAFREQLDALVGRINGAFATPTWTPIHYIYRSVDETTLLALYRAADVMLVTPVRDGMNLVAKEFVATRTDGGGVLILSEFAGAADELGAAVHVNPYDVHGTADVIHQALLMSDGERGRRMRSLRSRVASHTADRWASQYLSALDASSHESSTAVHDPSHEPVA